MKKLWLKFQIWLGTRSRCCGAELFADPDDYKSEKRYCKACLMQS